MNQNTDGYPSVTSDDHTGDTATQGFNTDVLESLDPALASNVREHLGLMNNGTDVFYGSDFVHPEHIPQVVEVLNKAAATDHVSGEAIPAALAEEQHLESGIPYVKQLSPNFITTGAAYFPAPSGSENLVTPVQIAGYDPKRYRITLHPWVKSGSVGQIWIGKEQSDISQSNGGLPMGGFPLAVGNNNANNMREFHWADALWAAQDADSTIDTYLFWTIEKYQ
jgi:hypothetical protein